MPFPHASMEQFTNGHLKILKVIFEKNLQNHYFTFMTLVKKKYILKSIFKNCYYYYLIKIHFHL